MSISKNEKDRLVQYIERVERLEKEKKDIQESIKDIFSEAKSAGYDIFALKQVIKLRKIPRDDLAQQDELIELYRNVLEV